MLLDQLKNYENVGLMSCTNCLYDCINVLWVVLICKSDNIRFCAGVQNMVPVARWFLYLKVMAILKLGLDSIE